LFAPDGDGLGCDGLYFRNRRLPGRGSSRRRHRRIFRRQRTRFNGTALDFQASFSPSATGSNFSWWLAFAVCKTRFGEDFAKFFPRHSATPTFGLQIGVVINHPPKQLGTIWPARHGRLYDPQMSLVCAHRQKVAEIGANGTKKFWPGKEKEHDLSTSSYRP
jgi:hypothetical protein